MEEFVSGSLALLSLERDAELRESEVFLHGSLDNPRELETRGICLQRLQVLSQRVGLYGRQVVTLEPAGRPSRSREAKAFPSNSISSGDIVGFFAGGKSLGDCPVSGVVTRCGDAALSVAIDDLPDGVDLSLFDGQLQIVRLANNVTYQRTKRGLEELNGASHSSPARHLAQVLFGECPLGPVDPRLTGLLVDEGETASSSSSSSYFPFFNPSLDDSQRHAVLSALARPDVAIVHGPPGTGKTTVVVEIILQIVARRQKVLACAPSNIAVDNLVERLARARAKVVRVGHPARLVESVLGYSLDALLLAADSAQIVRDVRQDIGKALAQCARSRSPAERRKWRHEVKTLRKELQLREQKALKELLSGADVVLATLTGASLAGPVRHLAEDHFDVVVIDECAQATEAGCWIPLLRAPKCVLAGDHKQLPPTIISHEAAKKGLSLTLMERLVSLHGDTITSMLTTQYRMHELIMEWPSVSLYDSRLNAHSSVANHTLEDLPGVERCRHVSAPLLLLDTAGCGLEELDTPHEASKGNEGEADLVIHHVKCLAAAGLCLRDIAVIAPYNLQVDLIRQRLPLLGPDHRLLEVRSVDGFQGREKEAVIISLTRSNKKGEVGFLSEERRLNVAVTRARRHLVLIGDSETVSHVPFIKGMVEFCQERGDVWSAHDYLEDPTFEECHFYKPKPKPKCLPGEKEKGTVSALTDKSSKVKDREGGKVSMKVTATKKSAEKYSRIASDDPPLPTVSDSGGELQERFRGELVHFLDSKEMDTISFPASLSGHERKIIHELCEELGLLHESRGEGKERYVRVGRMQKLMIPSEQKLITHHQTLIASSQATITPVDDQKADSVTALTQGLPSVLMESPVCCHICGASVPSENLELHTVQCERASRKSVTSDSRGVTSKAKAQPSKPKSKTAKKSSGKSKDVDDLDSLLAEVSLSDSMCHFPKCKKSVGLIGARCSFCGFRFCMGHSIPEVHGCSAAAKRHARQALSKEAGHGAKARHLDADRRAQLQKKLGRKIEDLSTPQKKKSASK